MTPGRLLCDLFPEGATRSKIHHKWTNGKLQAVVATIAFGMGIDKPNVRFIIHHTVSKSMENFYQETGRAGRDNLPARCIALYRFSDITKISTMVFTERTGLDKLYGVMAYAIDHKRCRRTIWAEHFGEDFESRDCNGMCDNCSSPEREATALQISPFADALKSILAQAGRADCRLTGLKLINSLMGKGEAKFRCAEWSPPKELNKPTAELVVANLLLKSFLKEDFSFTPYNTISYLVAGPLIESARFHDDAVEVPRGLCGKPAQRKQAKKRRPDTDDDGEPAPIPKKSVNVECISID